MTTTSAQTAEISTTGAQDLQLPQENSVAVRGSPEQPRLLLAREGWLQKPGRQRIET
jgi:hypothetical protein